MRWSRGAVPALVLCAAATLVGCGKNDPTAAGPGPAGESTSDPDARHDLGEQVEVGGLRVRVDVKEVGGDEDGPWLLTTLRVKNTGKKRRSLPHLAMSCENRTTVGYMVNNTSVLPSHVSPGRSVTIEIPLYVSDTPASPGVIPPCERTASISASVTDPPEFNTTVIGAWRLDEHTFDQLNASLPFTVPGQGPKDPGRPYAWTDGESAPEGYTVVSVPDMTAAEALRILDPIREVTSPDAYKRVVVDELDGGVVLFTYWLIPDHYIRDLSRGGIAASYGNTVNGDDHILVARDGRVVRSFDPFLDQDYVKTKPLPQEKGLDLKYDTWAASWTLLERLTKIHITEAWLYDDHPAYLLR